ncbi:hypothetical protein LSCM1_07895 [Leishmania martiniquensis]|uniref:AAA+ ATPase domain-containing protein n=1 Tax=Leishmania martiniquensis TaxID=1580590 RepID=A0A836KVN3_9TRYP|nr:hypothetical protein LSCM1_07895 [Leishmania martiniquensis]
MRVDRLSSTDPTGGRSSCSSSPLAISTDAQPAPLSSAFLGYSTHIHTSLLSAVRRAHAAILKCSGRRGDGDGECTRSWSRKVDLLLLPCAASQWLHTWYEALVTTRVCATILPQESDGPLVIHLALLLASLEVAQATSFYLRYRRAIQASAEAKAEAAQQCDGGAADTEESSDSSISLRPAITQAPSPPEMKSVPAGQSRLPRGSSRAMHRLCSYWALIEKAVRTAPRKGAGAPTDVADLGWISGHGSAMDNSGDCAPHRFAGGGAVRGAARVLVLSDEAAFPVLAEERGHSSNTLSGVLSAASTAGDAPLVAGCSAEAMLPTATEKPAVVGEPWTALHLLWTDMVRYSVTSCELRQRLLDCPIAEIAKVFEKRDAAESCLGGSSTAGGTPVPRSKLRGESSCDASGEALTNSVQPTAGLLSRSSAADSSAPCVTSPTTQGISLRRYADPHVAVPCLALVWYLSLVREVYEAVVVYKDVQRCADALRELEAYGTAVYQHGIEVSLAFFEEVLHSAAHSGAEGARRRRRRSSSSNSVALAAGAEAFGHLQCHERPMCPLEAASAPDGDAENAVVCSAAPMRGSAHLGARREPQESTPLCCRAGDGQLALPSSPRSFQEGLPVTTAHGRARGVSLRVCWEELTAALTALLRRRRRMELSHVRSLFSYLYAGSVAKALSFTVLSALTCLSSRVAAVGTMAREAISTNMDNCCRAHIGVSLSGSGDGSGSGPCSGEGVTERQRILALCLLECMRLAVNAVLTRTTHAYITMAASQRRNTMKAELYEALARLPLSFFDLHSFDEVEQIVYYVNDIEGVEVHVHHYLCGLVTSLLAMNHAMRQLPCRARLLVGATVAVSLAVKSVGRHMKQRVQAAQRSGGRLPPWLRGCNLNGAASATAELDAQVEENLESNARQGGVMLRGLDIIAVLPQLRPFSAELRIMRSWTDYTRACGAATGATEAATLLQGLYAFPLHAYGKLLPALGGALLSFADWVLPTLVASYGASMAFSSAGALSLSNRLIEAMRCVGDTVDSVADGGRVVEVVLRNAYKANVLKTLLDGRWWEPTTAEHARNRAVGGKFGSHSRDHLHYSDASLDCGPRAADVRPPHDNRWHRPQRSLCRPDPVTATVGPPSLAARCMRALRRRCCSCDRRASHALLLGGWLRLVQRGLAKAGLVTENCHGYSRRGPQKLYRHRRRPGRARHSSQRSRGQPQQERSQQSRHRRFPVRGGACEAAGVCSSIHPSEDDSGRGMDSDSSSLSFSDEFDAGSEDVAAAAAAVEVLTKATVHAVAVHNLQFYYPTAPTVPVFSRPVTCSFTLQGARDASSLSLSSASRPQLARGDRGSRGRMVCLVGPSGHGKSTLLSLLLGMYTNYGTSSHTLSGNSNAGKGIGDCEERQAGGTEAQGLPRATSSPAGISDIVLTLALPRSPPSSSDGLELAGSPDVASPSAASATAAVALERLSVSSIPRDILRGSLFSFVPQSPVIFFGATIAHNISLQNHISLEQEELLAEIAQCAAWAHCEFIQRFPQGLMTFIADSGTGAWSSPLAASATGGGGAGGGGVVRLSGGQAQRLMVARALFHGRRGGTVLLMDEPTASLDKEVKLRMLKEWRELLDLGIVRGTICATHDDDLIAVADEVVRLP